MAYTEIVGRTHSKQGDKMVYFTLGVCAAMSQVPKMGASLVNPDIAHTLPAICINVNVDKLRYPGRFFVMAAWDAPLLLSEVGKF